MKPTKTQVPERSQSQQRERREDESRSETAPDYPLLSHMSFLTLPQPCYVPGPKRSWILQERQEVVNRTWRKVKTGEKLEKRKHICHRSHRSHRRQTTAWIFLFTLVLIFVVLTIVFIGYNQYIHI